MTAPVHLFHAWNRVGRGLRHPRRAALLLDFDGTLAPIRRRPEQVVIPAEVRRNLRQISERGTVVAVISGRRLEDVRARVGIPGIWYVGTHGFFLLCPRARTIALLHPTERKRIERALRVLRRELRGLHGIRIEPKHATVAVHYRGASRRATRAARRVLVRLQERDRAISILGGKKIWEVLPGRRIDKWSAVKLILNRERRRLGRTKSVFYIGDDATDERVFENLHSISVAVGKRRRTAAKYFLRSPAEVARFLKRWIEVLT